MPVYGPTTAVGSPLPPAYVALLTAGNTDLPGAYSTTTKYDAGGRAIWQVVFNDANPLASYYTLFQQFSIGIPTPADVPLPGASGYDAAGNLRTFRTWRGTGPGTFSSEDHVIELRKFEGYVQSQTFKIDISFQNQTIVGGVLQGRMRP